MKMLLRVLVLAAGVLMLQRPLALLGLQIVHECSSGYDTDPVSCDTAACKNTATYQDITDDKGGSGPWSYQIVSVDCGGCVSSSCPNPNACGSGSLTYESPFQDGTCCSAVGGYCEDDSDCCSASGVVCGSGDLCIYCNSAGGTCSGDSDCCTGSCCSGTCAASCGGGDEGCQSQGGTCFSDGDCCDYLTCIDNQCGGDIDPIIIDTTGSGYQMTSALSGVFFAVGSTSGPVKLSWTAAASGDAWLALDLNGNGRIDNTTELFSNFMPIPGSGKHAANGFEVLAAYDLQQNGGNGDGVISAADAIYSKLLLWIDKNHNGISEPGELFTMSQLGIATIDLSYVMAKHVDQFGNVFRYRSSMTSATGFHTGQVAYDVLIKPVRDDTRRAGADRVPSVLAPDKVGVTPGQLVAGNPPFKGPAGAPVTVAVFSDFQCPFCAKAAQSIAKLQSTYGDNLRVVYRYYPLPFHRWAQPAAKAAACADEQSPAAFWALHDLYFADQSELSAKNVIDRSLATLGVLPGFDSAAFRRCVATPAVNAAVAKDVQLGNAARVGGTPTIFVNGERVEGTAGMTGAIEKILGAQSRASATASDPVSGAVCPRGAASAIEER